MSGETINPKYNKGSSHNLLDESNKYIDKSILPFIILVTIFLGFGIGIIASNILKGPQNSVNNFSSLNSSSISSNNINSDYFNKVMGIIQDKYIGDIPNKDNLTYGAIKGIVSSLNNEFNSFLTPNEAKTYLDNRSPNIEGIGVTLRFNGVNSEIQSTLKGYPGEKIGLKNGDVILEVNSENVQGMLPNLVSNKIRGPKGTQLSIKIQRKDQSGIVIKNFTISREEISLDNITLTDLGNGLYKLNIIQFLDTSTDAFNKKWDDIVKLVLAKNPKGLIIDLRNNPGGYVYSVRYVLEDFLKQGQTLMSEEEKNTNKITFTDNREGRLQNIPVVVLVNEGSASASEIFTASIQDNLRGKVVGKNTFGKGVEQQVITMDDSSLLIIVYQKWLTPNGKNISKNDSVKPDYIIDFTEDNLRKDTDPQLQKAKDLLS